MGRRRIAAWIAVAFFATFSSISTPHAGCDPDDLINGLAHAAESIGSACAAACADGAGCGLSGTIAATLGAVGQSEADKICSAVQKGIGSANSGADDANSLASLLTQNGVSASAAQQIANDLAGVAGVLGVAGCGCAIEQGVGQIGGDVGACIQDALCALDSLIGNDCSCTPPPPIQAYCAFLTTSCGTDDNDPQCGNTNNIIYGGSGTTPVNVITTPSGTFAYMGGGSSDGNGNCSAVQYCFCPAPMQTAFITDTAFDISRQSSIFTCLCPSGTHSGGAANGIPICLCDNTNQAMKPPGSLFGMCPPPSCPIGQIKIDNQCFAACTDPTQIILSDGQCCSPAQTTSCGTCCPAGQSPDPSTGSCVTRSQPVKLSPDKP